MVPGRAYGGVAGVLGVLVVCVASCSKPSIPNPSASSGAVILSLALSNGPLGSPYQALNPRRTGVGSRRRTCTVLSLTARDNALTSLVRHIALTDDIDLGVRLCTD